MNVHGSKSVNKTIDTEHNIFQKIYLSTLINPFTTPLLAGGQLDAHVCRDRPQRQEQPIPHHLPHGTTRRQSLIDHCHQACVCVYVCVYVCVCECVCNVYVHGR